MNRRRHARLTAVALTIVIELFLGGCGGGSSKSSTTTAGDSAATTTTGSGSGTTTTTSGGGAAKADIPTIANGTWASGRIHVEVTGDYAANFESDGSGDTIDGFTSLTFAQNEGKRVIITLGGDQDPSISVEVDDVATTASFGKDCNIKFTANDAATLNADFSCDEVAAIQSAKELKIGIAGNFKMAR